MRMRLPKVRFTIRRATVVAAALLSLWLISSLAAAYLLTRRSRSPFAEPPPVVAWGKIEPVRLTAEDGLGIGAWFVPGPADGPSVLLLHGNGGHRGSCLPLAEVLARGGCSVLALSLRAHGDSDGDRNDFGYGARRDVAAGVAFLERRRPGRPIVVQGTSLGAAAAIYAAGDLGGRVRGYVLESPYRDIYSAVRNRTAAYLPVPLDLVAYGGLVAVSPLLLPEAGRMSPLDRIADIPASTPILLLAGGRDDRARPDDVRTLHRRVAAHALMLVFDGARHESLWAFDPGRYGDEVSRFIEEATRRGPRR